MGNLKKAGSRRRRAANFEKLNEKEQAEIRHIYQENVKMLGIIMFFRFLKRKKITFSDWDPKYEKLISKENYNMPSEITIDYIGDVPYIFYKTKNGVIKDDFNKGNVLLAQELHKEINLRVGLGGKYSLLTRELKIYDRYKRFIQEMDAKDVFIRK